MRDLGEIRAGGQSASNARSGQAAARERALCALRSFAGRLVALRFLFLVFLSALALGAPAQDNSSNFDHTTTGWPLTGVHTVVRCETCHQNGVFKGTPRVCSLCHYNNNPMAAVARSNTHIPLTKVINQACDACHTTSSFKGVLYDHLGIRLNPVRYDPAHPSPASVGYGDCNACHNGVYATGLSSNHIPTKAPYDGCDTCHKSYASFADVYTVPNMPGFHPFDPSAYTHQGVRAGSCLTCHDGAQAPGEVAGHLPTVPPTTTSPVQCDACHGDAILSVPTTTFAGGTMNHTGIARNCASCHADGLSWYGVANLVTKSSKGTHIPTNLACENCHSTTNFTSFSTAVMNHTGISANCASCHLSTNAVAYSAEVPGMVTEATAQPPTALSPPHIPWPTRGQPISLPCENCHTSTQVPGGFASGTMNHAGITANCSLCHENPAPNGQVNTFTNVFFTGIPLVTRPTVTQDVNHPTTGDCSTCHTSTVDFTVGVSGAKPPTHMPTSGAATCNNCHTTGDFTTYVGAGTGPYTTLHLYVAPGPCAQCHNGQGFAGFVNGAVSATGFVPKPQGPPSGFNGQHIPTNLLNGAPSCEQCHSANKFDNFSGASMVHGAPAGNCASCHADSAALYAPPANYPAGHPGSILRQSTLGTHVPTAQPCEICHTGSTLDPQSGGTFRIQPVYMNHFNITTGCTTCHGYVGGTVPGPYYNVSVVGQAQMPAGATHIPTRSPLLAACETCHGLSGMATQPGGFGNPAATMSHANFPVGGGGCAACHASAVAPNFSVAGKLYVANDLFLANGAGQGNAVNHIPLTGAAWTLAPGSCDACHSSTTTFLSATMNHGGVAPGGCANCHESDAPGSNTGNGDTSSRYTGLIITVRPGTAMDPAHVQNGTAGAPASSADCGTCHSSTASFATGVSGGKPATHIPTLGSATCVNCHTTGDFTTYAGAGSGPYQVLHTYVDTSAGSCVQCHNGQGFAGWINGALSANGFVPKSFGVPNGSAGQHVPTALLAGTPSCDVCHAASKATYASFAGGIMVHGAATVSNCASCHANNAPQYVPPAGRTMMLQNGFGTHIPTNPAGSQACEICHKTSPIDPQSGGTFKLNPIMMNHSGVTAGQCTTCHAASSTPNTFNNNDLTVQARAIAGGNHIPTTQSCDVCHGVTAIANPVTQTANGTLFGAPAPVMNHTGTAAACNTCHLAANATTFTVAGKLYIANEQFLSSGTAQAGAVAHIPLSGASWTTAPTTCDACHGSTTSFLGAVMNHSGVATQQCATCHEADNRASNTVASDTSVRYSGITIIVRPGTAFDASHVQFPGNPADCGTCHTSTSSFGLGLAGQPANHIPNPAATPCATCHTQAAGGDYTAATLAGKAALHTNINAAFGCTQCHNTSTTALLFSGPTAGNPPPTNYAVKAQNPGHVPTTQQCYICHNASMSTFTDFTGGVMNHNGMTTGCAACHDDSLRATITLLPAAQPTLVTPSYQGAGNHIPLTASNVCEQCHQASITNNYNRFSGGLMKHGSITTGCATCHADGRSFGYSKSVPNGGTLQLQGVAPNPPAPVIHIPTTQPCELCHNYTNIDQPGGTFRILASPIMNHSGIATGCTTCHGYVGGTQPGPFTINGGTATQLLVIAQSQMATLYPGIVHIPSSNQSCEACHGLSGLTNEPDSNSSVGGFGNPPAVMNHASFPVGGGSCNTCHLSGNTSKYSPAGSYVISSEANLAGVGAVTHVPLTGAAWTTPPASCDACHQSTSSFVPTSTATMVHTGVNAVGCANCHEATASPNNVNSDTSTSKYTGNLALVVRPGTAMDPAHVQLTAVTAGTTVNTADCGTCHSSTVNFATGVTGGKPATHIPTTAAAACVNCHTTGDFNTYVGAPSGPYGTLHQYTAAGACSQCHAGQGFAGFVNGAATTNGFVPKSFGVPGGFSGSHINTSLLAGSPSCEACHAASQPNYASFAGGIMVHGGTVSNCASCHDTGTGPFAPPANYPAPSLIGLPAGYRGTLQKTTQGTHVPTTVACESCHKTSPIDPQSGGTFQIAANPIMNHTGITTNCTTCHNYIVSGTTTTPGPFFSSLAASHQLLIIGQAQVPVAGKVHIPSNAQSCEACHSLSSMNSQPDSATTTGGFGNPVATMSHANFAVGSKTCNTCHLSGNTSKYSPLGSYVISSEIQLSGGGAVTHIPLTGAAWSTPPTSCDACHQSTSTFVPSGTATMVHTGVNAAGCANCHEATANPNNVNSDSSTSKYTGGLTLIVRPGTQFDPSHVQLTNVTGTTTVSTADCGTCHSSTASFTTGVTGGTKPVGHMPTSASCGVCHTTSDFSSFVAEPGTGIPALGTKTVAYTVLHQNVTVSPCSVCHATASTATVAGGTAPFYGAQAPGGNATAGGFLPVIPPGAVGTMGAANHIPTNSVACNTCHTGAATYTSWAIAGAVATPTAKSSGTGNKVLSSALHVNVTTYTCKTCHETGYLWFGAAMIDRPNGHHGTTDCKGCHNTTNWNGGATAASVRNKPGIVGAVPLVPGQSATAAAVASALGAGQVAAAGGATAGAAKPGTAGAVPGVAMPGAANPGAATPGAAIPGAALPGAATSGAALPGPAAAVAGVAPGLGTAAAGTAGRAGIAAAGSLPLGGLPPGSLTPGAGASAPGAPFSHAGVLPGSCFTCHNGSRATGRPARHLPTTLSCDACHRTTAWRPAMYTHQGVVPNTCATCHNGQSATGKSASHFVTTRSCDACHRTTAWLPPAFYRHLSPAYVMHNPRVSCAACHTTRQEIVPYKFAAYRPACAACHVNQFVPALHHKMDNPPVPYTALELKDCSGSCHVYTDNRMVTIKTMRTGRHRPTDGAF